jgi:hypothetical protein
LRTPLDRFHPIRLLICHIDAALIPEWLGDVPVTETKGSRDSVTVVTWLPAEIISRIGLPQGSICGFLPISHAAIDDGNFIEYRGFIDSIHFFCAHHIDPGLLDFVRKTFEKTVAVIDQRSPDVDAEIPTEDIIGCYRIESRRIGGYVPNPNYRLVTGGGCFMLTPWLRKCLASAVVPGESFSI